MLEAVVDCYFRGGGVPFPTKHVDELSKTIERLLKSDRRG